MIMVVIHTLSKVFACTLRRSYQYAQVSPAWNPTVHIGLKKYRSGQDTVLVMKITVARFRLPNLSLLVSVYRQKLSFLGVIVVD